MFSNCDNSLGITLRHFSQFDSYRYGHIDLIFLKCKYKLKCTFMIILILGSKFKLRCLVTGVIYNDVTFEISQKYEDNIITLHKM